jgi:hypothetical protein
MDEGDPIIGPLPAALGRRDLNRGADCSRKVGVRDAVDHRWLASDL